MSDTIFALASGAGRGGVAVIRISGPDAGRAITALTGKSLPQPRMACLAKLTWAHELIDNGLVLWFPAPHSFTGEDVAEFHVHGGRAVLKDLSDALRHLGLRIAEPGEFSRRGFENGKFDLTTAEAIADLVDAETTAQRRMALRQMDGALATLYDGWRDRLIRALAYLEALIDFAEEDLPDQVTSQALDVIDALRHDIGVHLADDHRGERLRDGIHVAIIGAPNAGKSSLLNSLAGRDVAIVSDQAGTTRDIIEAHLDLGGYPVIIADTAGLRDTQESIEQEGIRRAKHRARAADIVVALFDGSALPNLDCETLAMLDDASLVVISKSDLVQSLPQQIATHPPVILSSKTGAGISEFLQILQNRVIERFTVTASPVLTRQRHRQALEECLLALDRARTSPQNELMAEDMRLAARALGRITGRIDVDDLLDVIFRDFCIGK